MKHNIGFLLFLWLACLLLTDVSAFPEEAVVGEAAPDFTATDTQGQTHSISDYKGKIIVLEWFNHGCPFVKKYYNSKNMQNLQKTYAEKGIIWLSICSSAPGKQGYQTTEEANTTVRAKEIKAAAIILDPDGHIGRKYGAKTTPHMFIINTEGTLVYNGAIDDKPSTKVSEIESAQNYVRSALEEIMAGEEVSTPTSIPYGCSVKYKK
jgi:peroxiredoxin